MLDNLELPNETMDKIYDDGFQPTITEVGKLAGRIPRAINAALSGLDQWILQREYNVVATKKALEIKLSNIDPDKIVPPEPYIAVPAMQAISYCMSNEELHDLYANLLSKAMLSDTKDTVHPSFVEIIKQMSPNDALTLKEFSKHAQAVPASSFRIIMKPQGMHLINEGNVERICLDIVTDLCISNLSEKQIRISVDNLSRLGLIILRDINIDVDFSYDFVKQSEIYKDIESVFNELNKDSITADRIQIDKKCFTLTPLGKLFCDICINSL